MSFRRVRGKTSSFCLYLAVSAILLVGIKGFAQGCDQGIMDYTVNCDERDSVFQNLLLWIDENHDGVSQPNELHKLPRLARCILPFSSGIVMTITFMINLRSWPVLPAPELRNSSCAHASESACAKLLPLAFADVLEPDSAHGACLGRPRLYPTIPHLLTAHRPPPSMAPTARPLLRQTNLPTRLAARAAT